MAEKNIRRSVQIIFCTIIRIQLFERRDDHDAVEETSLRQRQGEQQVIAYQYI